MKNRIALTFLFLLQAASFAAIDFGEPVIDTPYDPYFRPVQEVLRSNRSAAPSMQRARELMKTARAFRYRLKDLLVPVTPSMTARRQEGDCKDKSLWLCKALGDPSIRFVVGKWRSQSAMSHAWLLWYKDDCWWILDPTNHDEPIPAADVGNDQYLPTYSFSKTGKYRHLAWELRLARKQRGALGPAPVVGR